MAKRKRFPGHVLLLQEIEQATDGSAEVLFHCSRELHKLSLRIEFLCDLLADLEIPLDARQQVVTRLKAILKSAPQQVAGKMQKTLPILEDYAAEPKCPECNKQMTFSSDSMWECKDCKVALV